MGNDGWSTEESGFNKLGSTIGICVAILAAMLASGFFGVEIPGAVLWIAVAIAGAVGGAMNVAGRGPIWAGVLVGLVLCVGGFGAVWFWLQGRESVRKFELVIAFAIGAAPGFILQFVIQQILKKRAEA